MTRFIPKAFLPAVALCVGCAGARPFPAADPVWVDPDRHPFDQKPDKSFSPLVWDGMDRSFFQPHARFFAVESAGESVNVNALDEVPDSSWFENRIGRFAMSAGSCCVLPKSMSRSCSTWNTIPMHWTTSPIVPNMPTGVRTCLIG